jgi:exodeoxyribonuclease V gamma subunit
VTAQTPSLEVKFVRSLVEGLGDAIGFLESSAAAKPEAIFEQMTVVVPSVGVREWLTEQVALRLGATGARDGVAANISFRFPGVLDHFMPGRPEDDPWSVSAMTAALLPLCTSGKWRDLLAARTAAAGGPLRFASRMADRFDRYHARRPAMIRLWEKGARSLAPVADGPDDGLSAELSEHDQWQFNVWRDLRAVIGVPSLPSRLEVELADPSPIIRSALPSRLLVFGFSALGQHQIEVLRAIARYSAVTVVFVHPSPVLAGAWAATSAAEDGVDALPVRTIPSLPAELATSVLPLSFGWLRATRETQLLLGRSGVGCVPHRPDAPRRPRNLLEALQASVRDGIQGVSAVTQPDDSLRLHRCHGPARQCEVAHDAIVHALQDDPTLQLHEIAVMSPDIERMAPYLRATFGRNFVDSRSVEWSIPLVVADRALQRIDDGSRVFVEFLRAVGGRLDAASMQSLLGDPVLLASHGVDNVDQWWQWIARAEQRWGADAAHRTREGVDIVDADGKPEQRHTWLHTVQRLILGAVAAPAITTAVTGVHPLPDVEADELPSALKLAELIGALVSLVDAQSEDRTPAKWAAVIEDAFVALCGEDSPLLSVPSGELAELAQLGDTTAVPFSDVASHLADRFDGSPDARLSRFGGVLATSMASQRLVPYRVICLVGVDDEALGAGDSEGDDLIGRQQLIGDPDPRVEQRRAILDAVLSASDRLVICCNGQSLKNNDPIPTPVPISELLDTCRAIGAPVRDASHLELEVLHPRHSLSTRNFRTDAVVPGRIWSHDLGARDTARRIVEGGPAVTAAHWEPVAREAPSKLSVSNLVAAVEKPLSVFLEHSLKISRFDLEDDEVDEDGEEIPLNLDATRRAVLAGATYVAGDPTVPSSAATARRYGNLLPVTEGGRVRAQSAVEASIHRATAALPRGSWRIVEEMKAVDVVCGGAIVTATVPPLIELTADVVVKQKKDEPDVMTSGSRWFLEVSFAERQPTAWTIAKRFVALIVATAAGSACDGTLEVAGYGEPEEDEHGASSALILHRYAMATMLAQDDARTWLGQLVALHRLAALAPIPDFSGLAKKWAEEVAADPPRPAEREDLRRRIAVGEHPESSDKVREDSYEERIMFGDEPDIESIHRAVPAILEYRALLGRWWSPPVLKKGGLGKVTKRPYYLVGMANRAQRSEAVSE